MHGPFSKILGGAAPPLRHPPGSTPLYLPSMMTRFQLVSPSMMTCFHLVSYSLTVVRCKWSTYKEGHVAMTCLLLEAFCCPAGWSLLIISI